MPPASSVTITRRPMTREEARQLERSAGGGGFGPWYIDVAFGGALLVLPLLLVTSLLHLPRLQERLVPVAAALGGAAGLYFHLKGRRLVAPGQAATRRDIGAGSVEQLEATAHEAAFLPEFEDEGPAVFLAVAPDATLFLQGQYLYEIGEAGDRLRATVELARAPASRTVLDFRTSGEPLASLIRLRPGVYPDLPEDGDLIPLPLAATLERHAKPGTLQRRPAGRRRPRNRASRPD